MTALYPVLATRAKIQDRFEPSVGRTLDGSAFMRTAVFTDKDKPLRLEYDREAVRWLLEHVDGSPVVVDANTAPTLYGWQSRYAMFTGNPTIVGWDYHQRQQRPEQSALVQERVADVQTLYRTTDAALAHRILTGYGAGYVVVGARERAELPPGTAQWPEEAGPPGGRV